MMLKQTYFQSLIKPGSTAIALFKSTVAVFKVASLFSVSVEQFNPMDWVSSSLGLELVTVCITQARSRRSYGLSLELAQTLMLTRLDYAMIDITNRLL